MTPARLWSVVPAVLALSLMLLAALLTGVRAYPALTAAVCPGCYGLQRAAPGLYVERSMTPEDRARLIADVTAARAHLGAVFHDAGPRARLLACATEACNRRLGGRPGASGALAETLSTRLGSVVRLAPRGQSRIIVTHELAHVVLAQRNATTRVITGGLPAWVNEGLAVILSDDPRYLRPGSTPAQRCTAQPRPDLPASPHDWSRRAGADTAIYAEAACAMLIWLDGHGGLAGLPENLPSLPGLARR
ncbi:hypothetical protein [Rhodobacter ferrooxidans]|uniref:Uncharacterized protein n=1 Tax=Rhodobacter ferrooxidans TaxID=371731 RepID=C8S070_9RHOB|nr:hypothetical protein [Rhodobacter sp. SW2]EEW25679.1 conserved hypothetical protein [Rhodobacter sp. SW2]